MNDLSSIISNITLSPLDTLKFSKKPSAIICHTVKGKGFSFAENTAKWHHKSSLKSEEINAMYEALV